MIHSATDAVADRFTVIDDRTAYSSNQPTTPPLPVGDTRRRPPATVVAAADRK